MRTTTSTATTRERRAVATHDRPRRARSRRRTWVAGGAVAVSVATLLASGAVSAGATAVADAPAGATARHDLLQRDADAITAIGVSGVQARVTSASGRQAVVTSGVSDLTTQRPVSPHGRFRSGSTDKAFIATVLLKLASEGTLSLDDGVGRWLPGVIDGEGYDDQAITLRQLLHHTSGIGDSGYPPMETAEQYEQNRFRPRTPAQLVAAAMRERPLFEPGQGWSYSNTGYVVLGMVIERATGNAWQEEVRHRVIEPLGMRHTYFPGRAPGLPQPHAKGYTRFSEGGPLVDTTLAIDADAAGGHISTTADLNTFVRSLFNGRLLTASERRELTQTVPVADHITKIWPGARYGLGLFTRTTACGERVWTPSGDMLGYRTRSAVSADGRRSVVVSMSTQAMDSLENSKRQEDASTALIDHALCERAAPPRGSQPGA